MENLMKNALLTLALCSGLAFASTPSITSNNLGMWTGHWESNVSYKQKTIVGTYYKANPMVTRIESGAIKLFILNGESNAVKGTPPESQSTAWDRLN
jgi:hypothetical protein